MLLKAEATVLSRALHRTGARRAIASAEYVVWIKILYDKASSWSSLASFLLAITNHIPPTQPGGLPFLFLDIMSKNNNNNTAPLKLYTYAYAPLVHAKPYQADSQTPYP